MTLNRHLRDGLNICDGKITHPAVAEALSLPLTPAEAVVSTAPTGTGA
jgi:alanine dehydrogenase